MRQNVICLSGGGGTAGDVRPLIALALALRARGFEILLFADRAFERPARRAGISPAEWCSSSEVPQTFQLRTTGGQRWLWGKRRRYRDRWLRLELASHKRERTQAFWRRAGGPDNSRIAAAIGSLSTWRLLGSFGPQCAKIISCPMPVQPSREFRFAPPDLSLGQRLKEWIYLRTHAGERRQLFEQMYHLVSASPAVFPRPRDWLPNMQVTGYVPFDDDHRGWQPLSGLRDYLQSGSPPVYVGFGSYPFLLGPRGERLAAAIVEGCGRRGVRCLIQSADLPRSFASPNVFVLEGDVPHAWLFPRCAAIVHHGGYGTLHAALAARRPMIIYPFQADQFFWAARMRELGIGPGFTARLRDLSADRFERDLADVLTRECSDNAARLGAAVRAEQGLPVQVAAIESIVQHHRCGGRPLDWRMPDCVSAAQAPSADTKPRASSGHPTC